MKSKLFKTLLTGVVASTIALAGTQLQAAPLMQDQGLQEQDMQKPSPDVAPPADQAPPPQDQMAPAPVAPQPPDQAAAPAPDQGPAPSQRQYTPLSAEQLQQLVAPIALYPDALVAQILAASAYPTQIVEAHRFVQQNPDLKGQALGNAVDQQDWDPSVKALTQFPTVLGNLDRDLSWTSELGEANYNQSADVMQAIQYMRHKALAAGNLRSTPQQRVYDRGDQVEIQPADPDVVYVPQYNPYYVYGYPVAYWPGFYPWWGFGGPFISFGLGFPIGPFFGFGWGWHAWGLGWGFHGGVFFGGHPYAWRSGAFYSHNAFVHGNYRGYSSGRGSFGARGFAGERGYASSAARGYAGNRGHAGANGSRSYAGNSRGYAGGNRSYAGRSPAGSRSGAFNRDAARGPSSRGSSSRGRSSFSGGSHNGGGHSSHGGGHSSAGHSGGGHSSGGGHGGGGHGGRR